MNLPNNWRELTLADVCEKPQYGWTTKADHSGEGVKFLRTTDLTKGPIDWSSVPVATEVPSDLEKYRVKEGDLFISRAGSVGFSALIESDPPESVFASYLIRMRPSYGVEPSWVKWFARSPQYWRQISDSAQGIAVQNVNAKKLAAIKIPVPPLDEQQRIVNAIESTFSNIDAGVARIDSIRDNLLQLRTSIQNDATRGLLAAHSTNDENSLEMIHSERRERWEEAVLARGPKATSRLKYVEPAKPSVSLPALPQAWAWTTLDAVTYFIVDYRGKTPPTSDRGVRVLSAANVKHGRIVSEPARYVSEATYDEWTVRGLPAAGDLVITTEAPVAETALYPSDETYLLTRRVMALKTNGVDNRFLRLALERAEARSHIAEVTRGTTVPRILKPQLLATPIALPPLSQQVAIADEFDRLTITIDITAGSIVAAERKAVSLRMSVLKDAFSGDLDTDRRIKVARI